MSVKLLVVMVSISICYLAQSCLAEQSDVIKIDGTKGLPYRSIVIKTKKYDNILNFN